MSAEDVAQLELPWSAGMVEAFRVMVGGTIQAARIACGLERSPIPKPSEQIRADFESELLSYRRRSSPRVPESRRRLLSVQRRRCRRPRSAVAAASSARRSSTSMSTTATARRSSSTVRGPALSSPSRCTSSTTTRCGSRRARSTSACPTARAIHASCASWSGRCQSVMASDPQCVFYLAGADPYEDDQLGGLRLTRDGLRQRDRMVIEAVRAAGVPLVDHAGGRLCAPGRRYRRDPRRHDRRSQRQPRKHDGTKRASRKFHGQRDD